MVIIIEMTIKETIEDLIVDTKLGVIVKIIISSLLALLLFSGCAIKKNDSTTTVIIKHTINSPMYLLIGTAIVLNILYARPYYTHGHRIHYHSDYYSRGYSRYHH